MKCQHGKSNMCYALEKNFFTVPLINFLKMFLTKENKHNQGHLKTKSVYIKTVLFELIITDIRQDLKDYYRTSSSLYRTTWRRMQSAERPIR